MYTHDIGMIAFNLYSQCRDFLFLFIIYAYLLNEMMLKKIERIDAKCFLELFSRDMLKIISFSLIGFVLHHVGITIPFKAGYLPFFLFLLSFGFIILALVIDTLRFFRSNPSLIKNSLSYFEYIVVGETLLLSIMNNLEIIEMVVAILLISTITVAKEYAETLYILSYKSSGNSDVTRQDVPIETEDQLFSSRKRELDNFIKDMKNMTLEPYAIMLSGEWGYGKTSFVNAFRTRMNHHEFISIEAGFEYDTGKLLDEIARQLEGILEKNGIYAGHNTMIKKYFSEISELIGCLRSDLFDNLLKRINSSRNKGYTEIKSKLNQELENLFKLTGKHIFIIIDNLDRCKPDIRERMFEVIRECVNLNNCITIFVVDGLKFETEHLNNIYIEKYINRKYEFSAINFREIVSSYVEDFMNEDFLNNISEYMKGECKKLKQDVYIRVEEVLSKLDEKKRKLDENLRNPKNQNIDEIKSEIKTLEETIDTIMRRINNPRKVKRFLFAGIQTMVSVADIVWFSNQDYSHNDFSQCDWIQNIFSIAFLKYFLTEKYEKMIASANLESYEKYNNTTVEVCLTPTFSFLASTRNKQLFNMIMRDLYKLDCSVNRSEHQKLLDELNGEIREDHIEAYIVECIGYGPNFDYLHRIIQFVKDGNIMDTESKVKAIMSIMELASNRLLLGLPKCVGIYKEIKDLIDDGIAKLLFSEKDLRAIAYRKEQMQKKLIWESKYVISNILELLIDEKKIHAYFEKDIDNIENLYNTLVSINIKHEIYSFNNDNNKLVEIVNFLNRVEDILYSEKYAYAKDFSGVYICYYRSVIDVLQMFSANENEQRPGNFNTYFSIKDMTINLGNIKNVDDLHEALMHLNQYVDQQADSFSVNVFSDICKSTYLFVNDNVDWFDGKEKQVLDIMESIYDKIESAKPNPLQDNVLAWKNNKFVMYKLRNIVFDREQQKTDLPGQL